MPTCPSCNSATSPGTTICRSCGASIPEHPTLPADLEQQVRSLLDQGKKIEAVKVYKDRTGFGLKRSKDAVEALQRGCRSPQAAEADTDLEGDVLRLLGQGEKIKAVKLYKDRTDATLFDSKQAVDEIAVRNGVTVEGGGCSGVLFLSMVVLIAIAVVAVLMILRR